MGSCGVVVCHDKNRHKKFRILAKVTQSSLSSSLPNDGPIGKKANAIFYKKNNLKIIS